MSAKVHEIYPPEPDLDVAIDFLKGINPDGRQALKSIRDENGAPEILERHFDAGMWDQKRALIKFWASERRNVYVMVNEPIAGSTDMKEESVGFIRAVFSDTDHKGVQAAALASSASFVCDSGGGIHTFFVLPTPIAVNAGTKIAAETVGQGLQDAFDGDAVWNINRIMRVPGTVNYLNTKKRAEGRQIAPTAVLAKNAVRLTLWDLAMAYPATVRSESGTKATDADIAKAMAEIDMSKTGGKLPERLLRSGIMQSRLWLDGVTGEGDKSGSGHVYRLALDMRKGDYTATEFAQMACAWEKVDADNVTHRQLGRAWAKASRGRQAAREFDDGVNTEAVEEETEGEDWDFPPAGTKPEKTLPRRRWLYWRRLIRGYLSSTVAAGGTGKSSLAMVEAVSMVSLRNLLGIEAEDMPKEALRVLIWNGEDPQQELDLRLAGIMRHHQVTAAELGGRLFVVSGRDYVLSDGKGMKKLVKAIEKYKIDVVIIDPFVSSHSVPENDNVLIDKVAKQWSRIAEKYQCGVDLVHHIRKPGNGGVVDLTVDDARGASALINASRNARVLSPMSDKVARDMGITNRRAYFAIQHDATKANMVPSLSGASWFKFVSVELDNGDPFGVPKEDGDKVGVVEAWIPTTPLASVPANVIMAQNELSNGDWRYYHTCGNWAGIPIGKALNLDPKDRADAKTLRAIIENWLKEGWLRIEKKDDGHREKKEFIVPGKAPKDLDDLE